MRFRKFPKESVCFLDTEKNHKSYRLQCLILDIIQIDICVIIGQKLIEIGSTF